MSSTNASTNYFLRHPKSTITAVLLLVFLLLDLSLGYFFCPKAVGIPDAYYHHDLPKNYHGVKTWGERQYPVVTNSLGFIDGERREVPLVTDKYRLLLLGDSFVEGVGLVYNHTFAGLLTAQLAPYNVEVLNAGVTSYSPKLYYLKTKYLLEYVGLEFDELLVFVDISDIQDEIFHSEFNPENDLYLSKYYIVNKTDSFLRKKSFTYHSLRSVYDEIFRDTSVSLSANQDLVDKVYLENWEYERERWTVDKEVFEKWGRIGLNLAGHYIEKLKQLCDEHGIALSLAVYPWPTQIRYGDKESIQASYWRELSSRLQIDFLDYFPFFMRDSNKSPESICAEYFIPGDIHWNENGHRLVAEVILDRWFTRHQLNSSIPVRIDSRRR